MYGSYYDITSMTLISWKRFSESISDNWLSYVLKYLNAVVGFCLDSLKKFNDLIKLISLNNMCFKTNKSDKKEQNFNFKLKVQKNQSKYLLLKS